ncbi:MAG: hypothetical protein INR72_09030, partial [Williamsia herbipolensis]|nr:hypothetical protein [Williamsia herbipolensis]
MGLGVGAVLEVGSTGSSSSDAVTDGSLVVLGELGVDVLPGAPVVVDVLEVVPLPGADVVGVGGGVVPEEVLADGAVVLGVELEGDGLDGVLADDVVLEVETVAPAVPGAVLEDLGASLVPELVDDRPSSGRVGPPGVDEASDAP